MNPLSLEPSRFVVATDKQGAIVGFGQLAPLAGSSIAQEIRSVVVRKGYRGQGIGTAVVQGLLDRAGNAPVFLTTIEGPNVPFYARLGVVELPRDQVPPSLILEVLAGNVVTQVFFRKRCLVLGRVPAPP
jgi:N-acetylglutamate synthase-like GNAT family acetyltransferase